MVRRGRSTKLWAFLARFDSLPCLAAEGAEFIETAKGSARVPAANVGAGFGMFGFRLHWQ